MTQVLYRPKDEHVMYVVPTDSMGRTPDQVKAMEKNAVRPHTLSDRDEALARLIREDRITYPKVMYRLALKKTIPAGDEVAPSYPMPFDLAQSLGVSDKGFKVLGKTRDSGGYLQVRYPYISRSVVVYSNPKDPYSPIDHAASIKMEDQLRKEGWVDNPNEIEGLPEVEKEADYDPIPQTTKKAKPEVRV